MVSDFLLVDRYPELRDLELRQLARVLLSSDSGSTLGLFREMVKRYTRGELPHGGPVISTLYELMESDESVEETPLTVTASGSVDQQVDFEEVTRALVLGRALTMSLTSGTFLDSQFYAVESRPSTGMPKIRPIYFCRTVSDYFTFDPMSCKSLTRIKCGLVVDSDPSFQVLQNSGHKGCSFGEQMGAIAILTSKYLTKMSPPSAILVSNGSSICCWFLAVGLVAPSSVGENPTPMDLPLEPALLLNHGTAKTWVTQLERTCIPLIFAAAGVPYFFTSTLARSHSPPPILRVHLRRLRVDTQEVDLRRTGKGSVPHLPALWQSSRVPPSPYTA